MAKQEKHISLGVRVACLALAALMVASGAYSLIYFIFFA